MKRHRLAAGLLIAALLASVPGWCADTPQAARFYEDALVRFGRNDNAGAIIQLKNALQKDPSYLSAYLLLGQAQLRQGDLSGAELSLTTALRMGADPSEIAKPLADAYTLQGKHKELLEQIHPRGLPAPIAVKLWLIRAYAHLSLLDHAGAEDAINQAAALDPKAGGVAVARGMVQLQRGNLGEAKRYGEQAVGASPDDANAWNLKGSVAHAAGNAKEALADYAHALSLQPAFVDVRTARAALLIDLNRLDAAYKDLSYLKEKFPDEARAAYLRSVYHSRKGDPGAAKAELLLAAKIIGALPKKYVDSDPQLLMVGALTHFGIKAYEQAQTYTEGYLRLRPDDPGARKLLGSIQLSQGRLDAAIPTLEQAKSLAPRDPQVLNMLAAAYLGQKQNAKAAKLLAQAGSVVSQAPQLSGTLGFSLIGLGQPEQGLFHLTQAFAKNPSDFRLGSSLVMLNINQGKTKEALRVAEAFLAQHAKDPTAYNLLGVAKGAAGDLRGARAAYEKALGMAPEFQAARLNLGKLETAERHYDSARRQFQAILKSQANNPQAQYEMAKTELAAGRPAEAIRWLETLRSKDSRNVMAAVDLAELYLSQNQANRAVDVAKQISILFPENSRVLSVLGRAHAAAGQPERAKVAFSNLGRQAGFDVDQLVETARLQLAINDLYGASISLNKALTSQPEAIAPNALMAEVERRQGHTAKAFARTRQQASANPRSAMAQRALGDSNMALGKPGEAALLYKVALALEDSPGNVLSYYRAQSAAGEPAPARSALEDWNRRHPNVAEIQLALGEAWLREGDLPKARASYEAFLKRHGDHPGALNNLANILMKQGDANALAMAQRAYRLAPGDYSVNDTLGWLFLQQGQVDGALRYLREAKLRAPRNPEIRYHLAMALARKGQRVEARNELEQILRSPAAFDGRASAEQLLKELAASR
jgi:putative PEP-CTERM system TPR-repeat lipoprotein